MQYIKREDPNERATDLLEAGILIEFSLESIEIDGRNNRHR
jgi:hypothetical protein